MIILSTVRRIDASSRTEGSHARDVGDALEAALVCRSPGLRKKRRASGYANCGPLAKADFVTPYPLEFPLGFLVITGVTVIPMEGTSGGEEAARRTVTDTNARITNSCHQRRAKGGLLNITNETPETIMTRIAFLGLGAMGSRMAANLIKGGHEVTVWNRSSERVKPLADLGAATAGSPRAAAAADIVIAMVRDDEASRRVWLASDTGAAEGMAAGAVAVECSTLSVGWVRELGAHLASRRIAFSDAPLAGSRPQAEAGQLIFFVGGPEATVRRIMPVLTAMGSTVHAVGGVGAGVAVKLAVNALFGIQVAAMAEVIGLLKANGVDPARAIETIGATPVASEAAKGAAASMLVGSFAPMFPVELVEKDFGYIEAAAPAMPVSKATRQVMKNAIATGLGGDNLTGVVRLYRGGEMRHAAE